MFTQGLFQQDATGMTPSEIARRRAVLEAIMGGVGRAQNVGEGIGDMLAGLAVGLQNRRLNKAEASGKASAAKEFSALLSGGVGNGNAAATDNLPAQAGGDLASGIVDTAKALGIDPLDLGTAISYETAGTFDPKKRGPTTKWGQHRGLIQFGEPQAKQFGVDWNDPVGSQLGPNGAVARYLRGAGVRPGMGLLDIYSAINAGRVGRYNASDANAGGPPGTVRDKVEKQMAGHRRNAERMLAAMASDPVKVASLAPSAGFEQMGGRQTAQTLPMRPQMPTQRPVQTAQTGDVFPAAPSVPKASAGGVVDASMQQLMQAMQNPWLDDSARAIIGSMIEKRIAGQQPRPIEIGNAIVDANTGRVIYQGAADPGAALDLELKRAQIEKIKALAKEPIRLDAGTHWVLLDPITRAPVGQVPKNVGAASAEQALGKAQGEAQSVLPAALIAATETIGKIDELLANPDLGKVSGIESYMPDWLAGAMTDGKTLDLRRRVEQLRGTAFLEAYNGLRGGGPITEVEGKKAEDAFARLDTAQTDAGYRQALKDFRDAVATGLAKIQSRTGAQPAMGATPAGKRWKFNTATGELE